MTVSHGLRFVVHIDPPETDSGEWHTDTAARIQEQLENVMLVAGKDMLTEARRIAESNGGGARGEFHFLGPVG